VAGLTDDLGLYSSGFAGDEECAIKQLMLKNRQVMDFDTNEFLFRVTEPSLLPYSLLDYLPLSSDGLNARELVRFNDLIRTFFADRTLSVSREFVKEMLNAVQFNQRLSTEGCCRLSLMCRGVSMTDSYWVRDAMPHKIGQDRQLCEYKSGSHGLQVLRPV